MLCGEVQRRQERLVEIQAELTSLQQKIASFDMALGMVDSQVNPAAAGAIRGTAERYGGYGGLTRFLLGLIQAAGPDGIDTRQLTMCAAGHFDVLVASKADLSRYRKGAISFALRALRSKGTIESTHGNNARPGIWRMRAPQSAFSDLLRQKQEFDKAANGG